jgi:integrase
MLTETGVRAAKPGEKPRKLADARGLYLLINPNGSKLWRFKYRFDGKEKALAFGAYPEVPLKIARDKREIARSKLADGIDPGLLKREERRIATGEDTFETIANEWLAVQRDVWAEGHTRTIRARLDNDVIPYIGKRRIASITAPDLLALYRRVESRGAIETAHRIRTICNQVFGHAIATGVIGLMPLVPRQALKPVVVKPMAAVLDVKEIGALLRSIDEYKGTHVTRCAFKLAPLVFVRPGELRKAEWAEFDLDAAQWVIPASRMKLKKAAKADAKRSHIVPLSKQAVAILRDLHELTGEGRFVFPGARDDKRPMSENALTVALRRMGYDGDTMTQHGFRAIASTFLNERKMPGQKKSFSPDAIEAQLAHVPGSKVRAAYNRAAYLDERVVMMQAWADYLDDLKAGAKLIPLRKSA